MKSYLSRVASRRTPQSQPILGAGQSRNSAGGYGWAVDDWVRLDRFLILGCEGGSYYASEQALSLDVNLDVRRILAIEVVNVREHWTVALTPTGGPLPNDESVPDASITIAGTFEYSRSGQQYSLDVTTPTPLTYDADCNDTQQRIRAGELRAAGTIEGQDGYVQLVWNDCGDKPEVRFVAAGG